VNSKGIAKNYVVGFAEEDVTQQSIPGTGSQTQFLSTQMYSGGFANLAEPELTFIINKYSLPRGLSCTKKFAEVTESEQIYLEEQRRQRIEAFSQI
jgi:hypothetical protein